MPDVTTNFKPEKSADTRSPAQKRGATNRRKGLRKQRDARKVLEGLAGVMAGRFATQTGNEENWRLPWRVEVKSGKQVAPVVRAYTAAREQAEGAKAQGDPRPFVYVAMPDGASWGLLVVSTNDLAAFIEGAG